MKMQKWMLGLLMLAMSSLVFGGCGSSGGAKVSAGVATLKPAMEDFPNAGLLVSPESLQSSLGASNLVIIDARVSVKDTVDPAKNSGYYVSHLPGAITLQYGDYKVATGLLPLADLQTKLSAAGLKKDATIVIYDDTTTSWGAAGRVFWMLEFLGCNDIHILNGGWNKWVADARPTETKVNTLPPSTFVATVNNDLIAKQGHILNRLGDPDFALIDSRTDDEFNGWQLYGEARGGHITGAVQVPYDWFYYPDKTTLSYKDLRKIFESRGITSDKEVSAYCTAGIRSGYVYYLLRLMGYPRCSNYDGSIAEWSATPVLPMEKLPNYSKLVSAGWVKNLIDGKAVPNAPAGRYVVVGAKHRDSGYVDKYIPGSILLNKYEIEWYPTLTSFDDGVGRLWPDATLKQLFESDGIDKDTTVIVYHEVPGGSVIFAARVAWALMYAGVKDVRIVNGGIDSWVASGYPTTLSPAAKTPVASFGTAPGEFPVHPEYNASTGYIEEIVAGQHPNAVLGDIRSMQEFIGGTTEYPSIGIPLTAVGRIPGAKWGHWGPSSLVGGDYWDAQDKTLRSYTEIRAFWAQNGITSDKSVSFYCGTGYRSAMAFYLAYLMGWPDIKNYDGGFFEWAQTSPNAASHPIVTGWP